MEVKRLKPSQNQLDALVEIEGEGSVISQRIKGIEKDFLESIESMPTHKARINNFSELGRQGLVDFAFAFFVAGISSCFDPNAYINDEKFDLESRRDLN